MLELKFLCVCKYVNVFLPTYHATDHSEGAAKAAEKNPLIMAPLMCRNMMEIC